MAVLNCTLCAQIVRNPVPADSHTFCCHACKQIFEILGAEQVELLKSQPGIQWDKLSTLQKSPNVPSIASASNPQSLELGLTGVWCPSCCQLIDQVVKRQTGVLAVKSDFTQSTMEVLYDADAIDERQIEQEIRKLGYATTPKLKTETVDSHDVTDLRRRFSVSFILTFFMMMLSIPIWSGYLPLLPAELANLLSICLGILATPTVFWCGWPFLRGAWSSVMHAVPTMDLLVSIGSLSAYSYSLASFEMHENYLYFDTSGLLITFLLLSRLMEAGTKQRALSLLDLVRRLLPTSARRQTNEGEIWVTLDALLPNDAILIRTGEIIPVDGRVCAGSGEVDEAIVTGEAQRRAKTVHDHVYAGSTYYGKELTVEVVRATDSLLAQTVQYVRSSQATSSKWNRLAQRILLVFVPFVLGIAIATFAAGLFWEHLPLSTALLRAISVLVIGCPCALSIATPVAILGCAQQLAKQGIVLRSPDAIERAEKITSIVFDKTGTLTTGRMTVQDYWPRDKTGEAAHHSIRSERNWLSLAASAEYPAEHPIADALVRFVHDSGYAQDAVDTFTTLPGWGVQARVGKQMVQVGASALACEVPASWRTHLTTWQESGLTTTFVIINDALQGIIGYASEIRPEATSVIQECIRNKIQVYLASGDHALAVQQIASQVGITQWFARQTPLAKAQLVSALKAKGEWVCFVGDGINDAPALVASNVGIAMGSSADIALEAGHMILTSNNLHSIGSALHTVHLAARVVKQNLFWALGYNLIAQFIALRGWATPILAASAMVVSSMFVLGNSLRVVGWSPWLYVRRVGQVTGIVAVLCLLAYFRI